MKKDFEELLNENKKNLIRYVYSISKNESQAKDLIADTIYYAYINFEKLKNKQSFLSYLFTIATRLRNVYYKNQKSYNEDFDLEQLSSNDFTEEEKYDLSLIKNAIKSLKDKYKDVITLTYFYGFSSKEVANILNITNYNVKIRLNRAKKQLKEILSIEE